MKPYDNILPETLENKQQVAAAAENLPCPEEAVDMCTMQYYCAQPICCPKLAHAYVPFQCLNCLYTPEKGLKQGTIFPELDRPYGADPEYVYDA